MRKKYILFFLFFSSLICAQRPETGDKIFSNKYPKEQINLVSNTSLEVESKVDEDLIVTLRDGGRHFISHVYLRAFEKYTFENLPVGHFIYQYHNLTRYFESPERLPILLNQKNNLDFFYSAGAKKIIGFEITKEEFFKN
tara:strand:- start:510 stop:929 length:420 start_codon:yes stop_codon:yes gene_type:complete